MRITLQLGTSGAKTIYVGQSLNDDIYHSVVIRRRGRNVRATVDDDEPLVGKFRWNVWFCTNTRFRANATIILALNRELVQNHQYHLVQMFTKKVSLAYAGFTQLFNRASEVLHVLTLSVK